MHGAQVAEVFEGESCEVLPLRFPPNAESMSYQASWNEATISSGDHHGVVVDSNSLLEEAER